MKEGWGSAPNPANRGFGLDLVRAVAILFVLFAHDSNFLGVWFGFNVPLTVSLAGMFGVELFFVLSGLLIGRLLLDIAERGPTLRNLGIFLLRRWMRILPLYFLWLTFLLLVRPPAHRLGWHILHYATLTQNFVTGMPPGEFFPVTWTLTIEEWFYVLFGAAAIGAVALFRHRAAIWLPILLFLVIPSLLRWQVPNTADIMNGVEKVVVLRLDAIAFGVVLATLLRRWTPPLGLSLNLLASGLTVIWLAWTSHVPWPEHIFRTFVFTLVLVGWTLCLPVAVAWGRCGFWFAAPVRWLSRYSYGLYLTHVTLLEIAGEYRNTLSIFGVMAIGLVGPFLLAMLSWHLLEAPILARRPLQQTRTDSASLARHPAPVPQ